MMKKKLLILSFAQFGYLTDTLKYCEYAVNEFDITYIGWDYNKPEIKVPGVKVQYISRTSNLFMRNFNLLKAFHKEIRKGYNLIFANYKSGISIVKLLNRRANFIIDIRTLCVNSKVITRIVFDFFLKLEVLFFNEVSVISEGIARKLKLRKYHILPLGGECFTEKEKSFEKLSFLYVGTLDNRNIIDCVKAFHLFLKNLESMEFAPTLTIVGDSDGNELMNIQSYVKENALDKYIIITGYVPSNRLKEYFENANIGISYIPLKPYYDDQPATKTFEYLVSGLAVLGTSTCENKKVIRSNSGVLVKDGVSAFLTGIHEIYSRKDTFNSQVLRSIYAEFTWQNIVNDKFISLVKRLT